ncbi:hypothetical protein Ava_B0052 (plasmid) [Trichormus variabilis ATCC 29413]|uniref:Uncharacterized protein n=3 Tax=Anabaena variabilis TaxID=264691 RepID=Q3M2M0_TRIV2|nr:MULTISPECIES: hypothetical protein [Nostocaceae]ABA24766.1 hypothetical protein Ava_B0052 [Trichormus variabilis ATCC 29413]MBC1218074.1 hypothetical protein [Trichormus variabilis ARAD]MBC1259322.1 hypothetical protein [Trichormus variabilis V5]MBC1270786.1 hypothetical protein [Trichormus variabilis FSR]MBC1305683.1 hypothetical protein [Trichormus variabilis N2B]
MINLQKLIRSVILGVGLAVITPQFSAALAKEKIVTLAQVTNNWPVVKSAGLSPDMDVPWSKPVRITDLFEGELFGFFDRNSIGGSAREGSKQVISLWTPQSIRVLTTINSYQATSSFYTVGRRYFRPDYVQFSTSKKVDRLLLKVRQQIFQLEGVNNQFAITRELATALKNAPEENLNIRLVLEGGQSIDSEIGTQTVKAWRNIY